MVCSPEKWFYLPDALIGGQTVIPMSAPPVMDVAELAFPVKLIRATRPFDFHHRLFYRWPYRAAFRLTDPCQTDSHQLHQTPVRRPLPGPDHQFASTTTAQHTPRSGSLRTRSSSSRW